MTSDISQEYRATWQVPSFELGLLKARRYDYCVVIPVINEGERIARLLKRMELVKIGDIADIIIVDGGSTDGSLAPEFLERYGVRGLVVKTGPGKLSAQLRCGYAFALDEGYRGIVTIDGNDKDDPAAIPRFIDALKGEVDFVQASRFIPGGVAENTPRLREIAIRFVHAPLLSFFSGFRWTDTTQGFRAYSRRMLLDPRLAIFRDEFCGYELLFYMSYMAPKLGYTCIESPSARVYPTGEVPTKIGGLKGNVGIFVALLKTCFGYYKPRTS